MQNKPNLLNAQMNVCTAITMDYVNIRLRSRFKNKANSKPIQSQFKANSKPIKANFNAYQTQTNPTCSEHACTEQGRSVEPILHHMRRKKVQKNVKKCQKMQENARKVRFLNKNW